jgi:primosomal protein N' (replication factor Y) (superfamily II helicase)
MKSELTDEEFLIYEALQNQSSLRIKEIIQLLDKKTVLPVINSLVSRGVVVVNQEIYEQYKPKLIRYVKLNEEHTSEAAMHSLLDELGRAPKQREVILTLFQLQARSKKPLKLKELVKASGSSSAVVKTLIDKKMCL